MFLNFYKKIKNVFFTSMGTSEDGDEGCDVISPV